MKIYFDNVLIDEDAYAELTNDYKLFTDNFYLGSTASNTFKITVAKTEVSSHPSEVKITDDTNTYYLIVDKVTEEKNFYIYELVDKLVLFNFEYDASVLIDARAEDELTTTLTDILTDMCTQAGIELDSSLVLINDIEVTWYDNRLLARDYLSYIAELQGGHARILDDGKLTIVKQKTTSKATLQIDNCEDFLLGEKKTITRVVYDGGAFKWEFGDDIGDTLYLQSDNVFIVNEQIVENIYNNLKDFEFYLLETGKCQLDPSVRAGDVITFTDGANSYSTIAQYSGSYGGGYWLGNYSLNIATKQQEETQVTRTSQQVRNIQTKVDRINNEFSVIAEEIEKLTDYIRNVGNTGDSIKLPNTPRSSGAINTLSIKGFELMPLYPGMAYPSEYTYPGALNFYTLIFSNELVTYSPELPIASEEYENMLFNVGGLDGKFYRCVENEWIEEINLSNVQMLYINSPIPLQKITYGELTHYDEILIENNKVNIVQRIGYNFDNEEYYLLDTPIIHELNDVILPTFSGDTYLTLIYFTNLTYDCEYIMDNPLTNTFATQLESSSQFRITQNELNLKASKKDTEAELKILSDKIGLSVSKNDIISSINLSPEAIQIDANKISLEGLTTINENFKVLLDGSIEANKGTFKGDIFLPDGGKVVGGDGILTNLMFSSAGGETPVGWVDDGSGIVNWALDISYIIPSNFTITEAYVTLYHVPVKYSNSYWGYSRAVKLFKVINYNRVDKGFGPLNIPNFGEMSNVSEITNAFGSSGFTAQVATDQNHVGEHKVSANISSSFSAGEHGVVLLKTTESRPSSIPAAYERTGQVFATLNIIGYMSH